MIRENQRKRERRGEKKEKNPHEQIPKLLTVFFHRTYLIKCIERETPEKNEEKDLIFSTATIEFESNGWLASRTEETICNPFASSNLTMERDRNADRHRNWKETDEHEEDLWHREELEVAMESYEKKVDQYWRQTTTYNRQRSWTEAGRMSSENEEKVKNRRTSKTNLRIVLRDIRRNSAVVWLFWPACDNRDWSGSDFHCAMDSARPTKEKKTFVSNRWRETKNLFVKSEWRGDMTDLKERSKDEFLLFLLYFVLNGFAFENFLRCWTLFVIQMNHL